MFVRLVIQRVDQARVDVAELCVAKIDAGLLVLAGVEKGDGIAEMVKSAAKVAKLRVFADDAGKMNLSVGDVGGKILAVSQFTLAGSIAKGRRPGFDGAMDPGPARVLFDRFVEEIRGAGLDVATGAFGADMRVSLVNDGPVTFVYDATPKVVA